MKHNIIVKFNNDVKKDELFYNEIQTLFNNLLNINGIYNVKLLKNCIERENRYDLVIQIEMDKDVLPIYDESIYHKTWKEKYGTLINKKAIFDYEE